MTGISYFAQLAEGAGSGSWLTGSTSLICLLLFLLSLQKGEYSRTRLDWISLAFGLGAIIPWVLTKDPLISVILVSIIDALGFVPTTRKSYSKPHEETISMFFVSGLKWILSLFALQVFSPVTWIFPTTLIFTNWGFMIFVLYRRWILSKSSGNSK